MPSFDIVSEVDHHEITNAIDQASREISNRYDFKGSSAAVEAKDNIITLIGESDFQVSQVRDIVLQKLAKRGIDIGCIETGKGETSGMNYKQSLTVREGIDKELAKKVVKFIKDTKLKVQASVQGDQVRVSGKKRDDLQQLMQEIKSANWELPFQFTNFRD